MNQGDLENAVAEAIGAKKAEVARVVAALLDTIRDGLKRGEKVAFSGFGTFETTQREARQGRNPRTGEAVKIAAKKVLKFEAAKAMKESLNSKRRGRKKGP